MTTRSSRPPFKTSSLTQAIEQFGPSIDSFTAELDAVSDDIKALESYLESRGIRHEAKVEAGIQNDMPPNTEVVFETPLPSMVYPDEIGSLSAEMQIEFVVWCKCKKSDRWRLYYQRRQCTEYVEEFQIEVFRTVRDFGATLDERPLIETPAQIRLRCSAALPKLLEVVASSIKRTPLAMPEGDLP